MLLEGTTYSFIYGGDITTHLFMVTTGGWFMTLFRSMSVSTYGKYIST